MFNNKLAKDLTLEHFHHKKIDKFKNSRSVKQREKKSLNRLLRRLLTAKNGL